jgi:hypothetical protein
MDARDKGFGLVIPLPFTATSQLGNVVYIDDEGIVEPIGNILKESSSGFSEVQQSPCGSTNDPPTKQNHFNATVAITTAGLHADPLTKKDCERYVCINHVANGVQRARYREYISPSSQPNESLMRMVYTENGTV